VLPGYVSRADAVAQAARLTALALGLERGDGDLVRGNMEDLVAEPARRHLYPGFEEARRAGMTAGALGVAVSGAGPTLVALAPSAWAARVAEAMAGAYGEKGIGAASHVARADEEGARVLDRDGG
jgi:homoserine kinase